MKELKMPSYMTKNEVSMGGKCQGGQSICANCNACPGCPRKVADLYRKLEETKKVYTA